MEFGNMRLELNKIYNMDCLEGMKKLPDNFGGLVLTDPPYGIDENNERNLSRGKSAKCTDYGHYEWDKEIPPAEAFEQMKRISKNQIIFGGNYFLDYLGKTNCFIVWDKDNENTDFADCEIAWTSFKSAVRLFKYRWNGMLRGYSPKDREKRYHPTQKPLKLALWIVKNYSKEGEIIIDPYCGSGTFMVAAQLLNRRYIGFDINQKYVDIANKRLKQQNLKSFF